MTEIQAQAFIDTLQAQRNNALNAVAQSEGINASLRAKVAELEKALADASKASKVVQG